MTREEAYNRIDAIIARHEIDDEYVTITSFLDYDALRMARKALEQEPCEETISRFDMLDAIGHGTTYTSEDLQRIIKALPPVTPQPKTDFEHKAEIVISQLRADRDRLADAIEKIRAEISVRLGLLDCKRDILAIIDKYKESEEK